MFHRLTLPSVPLAIACLFALACSSTGASSELSTVAAPGAVTTPQTQNGDGWVDSVIAHMSLRDKAAQMVWPSVVGDYVSADALAWQRAVHAVTDEKVGGFTISIGSPTEIATKLNALQRLSQLPLLFGADLEAGAGFRARGGWFLPNAIDLGGAVVFPPQMAVGATGDSSLAYEQGRVTAIEGRALGIQIAYAPVLDVNNNPANPVINTRSFGGDPRLVSRLGASFIRGVQEHGMVATGKHFPGHGDTGTNSHLALPVVTADRARIDSVELVPFRSAISAGVGAIMSFHGAMPALDPSGDPGTLSQPVLTGLLRDQLRFDGIAISDAMDMRGVLDRYGAAEAAIRAVSAGADVLIQPENITQAIDALVSGVTTKRFAESRLDRSVRRILALKERLGLTRKRTVDIDSLHAIVGDSTHAAVARLIAERSITLVKDSLHLLPLNRLSRGARVLAITVARRPDLGAGLTFNAELRRYFSALRAEYIDADDPGSNFARLMQAADSADAIVVSSYVSTQWNVASITAPSAFADFIHELVRRGRKPVVVAMGNPYFLQQIPEVSAYLVGWGGFPLSQQAAARALLGVAPITGHLPIAIPPLAPIGAGESRAIAASSR